MKKTISLTTLDGGLSIAGSKDRTPPGKARRFQGISPIRSGIIRVRYGSTVLFSTGAHSLYRYDNGRYQGSGTQLYKNGTSIFTGFNGSRLAFVRAAPTQGVVDHLFVAGGGLVRKVDPDGNVTQWGIGVPTSTTIASVNTLQTNEIDDFDAITGWTAGTGSTRALESTIFVEGTGSIKWSINKNSASSLTKSITIDLTGYAGEPSPDEDPIRVWLRVDRPDKLENLALQFSLGNTTFATDTYTAFINTGELFGVGQSFLGTNDYPGVPEETVALLDDEFLVTRPQKLDFANRLFSTKLPTTQETWVEVRLPKLLFTRDGDSAVDWADVQAVRFLAEAGNKDIDIYIDQMQLEGGFGLQGTYKYLFTFKNSKTGSRSNANTTAAEVVDVKRQSVALASIPTSTDSQVDTREIWRTVGNGSRYFLLDTIANNTTTTYTDEIPDWIGMDSSATTFLSSTELPTDNIEPEDEYEDTWGPHLERVWWCRDTTFGRKGRAYYSPVGRAEAVESFVNVSDDGDPTQKGITWDARNWVFTKESLYRVDGTGPFTSHKMPGVPGTCWPHTVASTPVGIIYRSNDGIRVFNGTRSVLLFPDDILPVLRGYSIENISSFKGVIATFGRDEYIISDTANHTLAVNVVDGRWRDIGLIVDALYFEPDTGDLIAGHNSQTIVLEDEGATSDPAGGIPLSYEPGALLLGRDPGVYDRVYLDLDTNGQTVYVTIIADNEEIVKPPAVTSERDTVVYTVQKPAKVISVRLHGFFTQPVEVYNIWYDVDTPDMPEVMQV